MADQITEWATNDLISGARLNDYRAHSLHVQPASAGMVGIKVWHRDAVDTANLFEARSQADVLLLSISETGNLILGASGHMVDFSHSGGGLLEASNTTTGLKILSATTKKLGFYGATPIVRPSAYTQTYGTADKTLAAYTPDDESVAYTGQSNTALGTTFAKVADLNALRVAYENLRAFVEDAVAMLNASVDDMQALGLVG